MPKIFYDVIHFFTLGFMKEYIVLGIMGGFLCGCYLFFRSGALLSAWGKNPKSKKKPGFSYLYCSFLRFVRIKCMVCFCLVAALSGLCIDGRGHYLSVFQIDIWKNTRIF